jgi:hypothetical protein
MGRLSSYPPGHPTGVETSEIQMVCSNPECEDYEEEVTVTQVYERAVNAAYIEPEDDQFCPACGDEREDA